MEAEIGLALMHRIETIVEAFTIAFALAIVEERALALLFNWRIWKNHLDGRGLKVPIAFMFAFIPCYQANFDLVSQVLPGMKPNIIGIFLTAMLVAGGSALVIAVAQTLKKGVKEIA